MRAFTVEISKEYGWEGNARLEVMLRGFPLDDKTKRVLRPCVIVVPGGGYTWVSTREGEPVASYFMGQGYHTCVLTYDVSPAFCYPTQLLQLAASVDHLKRNAEEYQIDPTRIYCIGFSAGGHLVADLAVEWDRLSARHGVELDARPAAVGLGYPVISSRFHHSSTHQNLLCGYEGAEREQLLRELQLDEAVTETTAPAFVWTTAEDTLVPPANSMAFAMVLDRKRVPYELHVFPKGPHGLSTATTEVGVGRELATVHKWMELCRDFFALHSVT